MMSVPAARKYSYLNSMPTLWLLSLLLPVAAPSSAQQKAAQQNIAASRDARAIIASAAATELEADRNDHTAYIYRDHDIVPGHDTLSLVVQTPAGNLKRKLEEHGQPLGPAERRADDAAMEKLVHDASLQHKQQHDNSHDDDQAEKMLRLLPRAFIWTVLAEQGDSITLDFKPDPGYELNGMEEKVFGSMAGQVVVAKADNRIRSMNGKMITDVKILGGILGGLRRGGTFQVERREVLPHHWQVTELHVHITGKAIFATIGSQEDETMSDFKLSPAKNLQEAAEVASKMP